MCPHITKIAYRLLFCLFLIHHADRVYGEHDNHALKEREVVAEECLDAVRYEDREAGILILDYRMRLNQTTQKKRLRQQNLIPIQVNTLFAEHIHDNPSVLHQSSFVFWIPTANRIPKHPDCSKIVVNADIYASPHFPKIETGDRITICFTEKGELVDFEQCIDFHYLKSQYFEQWDENEPLPVVFQKNADIVKYVESNILEIETIFPDRKEDSRTTSAGVVVDSVSSLLKAIEDADEKDVIRIATGVYRIPDKIVVDKEITLVSQGDEQTLGIVLEFIKEGGLVISGKNPIFSHLTFKQTRENPGPNETTSCVLINNNSNPRFYDCSISSSAGSGVVAEKGSDPLFKRCRIMNCTEYGVLLKNVCKGVFLHCMVKDNSCGVCVTSGSAPLFYQTKVMGGDVGINVSESGEGLFRNCEISTSRNFGIVVTGKGKPAFFACRVSDHPSRTVFVTGEGYGIFESCDIFNCGYSAFEISGKGSPWVRNCRIENCKSDAVKVYDQGKGFFEYCDISNNEEAGFNLFWEGNPRVRRCTISGFKKCGVRVWNSGIGSFEENKMLGNGWQIENTAGAVLVCVPAGPSNEWPKSKKHRSKQPNRRKNRHSSDENSTRQGDTEE